MSEGFPHPAIRRRRRGNRGQYGSAGLSDELRGHYMRVILVETNVLMSTVLRCSGGGFVWFNEGPGASRSLDHDHPARPDRAQQLSSNVTPGSGKSGEFFAVPGIALVRGDGCRPDDDGLLPSNLLRRHRADGSIGLGMRKSAQLPFFGEGVDRGNDGKGQHC